MQLKCLMKYKNKFYYKLSELTKHLREKTDTDHKNQLTLLSLTRDAKFDSENLPFERDQTFDPELTSSPYSGPIYFNPLQPPQKTSDFQ